MTRDWGLYDTGTSSSGRIADAGRLEARLRRTYRDFYRWSSILRAASAQASVKHGKHASTHGLEEVRAAVGLGDSRETAPDHDAASRRRPLESDGEGAGLPDARAPAAPSPLPIASPRTRPN